MSREAMTLAGILTMKNKLPLLKTLDGVSYLAAAATGFSPTASALLGILSVDGIENENHNCKLAAKYFGYTAISYHSFAKNNEMYAYAIDKHQYSFALIKCLELTVIQFEPAFENALYLLEHERHFLFFFCSWFNYCVEDSEREKIEYGWESRVYSNSILKVLGEYEIVPYLQEWLNEEYAMKMPPSCKLEKILTSSQLFEIRTKLKEIIREIIKIPKLSAPNIVNWLIDIHKNLYLLTQLPNNTNLNQDNTEYEQSSNKESEVLAAKIILEFEEILKYYELLMSKSENEHSYRENSESYSEIEHYLNQIRELLTEMHCKHLFEGYEFTWYSVESVINANITEFIIKKLLRVNSVVNNSTISKYLLAIYNEDKIDYNALNMIANNDGSKLYVKDARFRLGRYLQNSNATLSAQKAMVRYQSATNSKFIANLIFLYEESLTKNISFWQELFSLPIFEAFFLYVKTILIIGLLLIALRLRNERKIKQSIEKEENEELNQNNKEEIQNENQSKTENETDCTNILREKEAPHIKKEDFHLD